MTPIRAIVFDMDGVLIDSEPLWREAQVHVLGALGVPLTLELCGTTTGLRIDAVVEHWFARHPWQGTSITDVVDAITLRVASGIRESGQPLPGVMTAVRAVQHSGLLPAIATSSPYVVIDAVVERLHLQDFLVCSGMDEAAGKPHPAVYRTAARRLNIEPESCLAIEDSAPGVASARAAGMRVVAVEEVEGADWFVPTTELAAFLHAQVL